MNQDTQEGYKNAAATQKNAWDVEAAATENRNKEAAATTKYNRDEHIKKAEGLVEAYIKGHILKDKKGRRINDVSVADLVANPDNYTGEHRYPPDHGPRTVVYGEGQQKDDMLNASKAWGTAVTNLTNARKNLADLERQYANSNEPLTSEAEAAIAKARNNVENHEGVLLTMAPVVTNLGRGTIDVNGQLGEIAEKWGGQAYENGKSVDEIVKQYPQLEGHVDRVQAGHDEASRKGAATKKETEEAQVAKAIKRLKGWGIIKPSDKKFEKATKGFSDTMVRRVRDALEAYEPVSSGAKKNLLKTKETVKDFSDTMKNRVQSPKQAQAQPEQPNYDQTKLDATVNVFQTMDDRMVEVTMSQYGFDDTQKAYIRKKRKERQSE